MILKIWKSFEILSVESYFIKEPRHLYHTDSLITKTNIGKMHRVALAKYKGSKETRICYNLVELQLTFHFIHLWKHGSHLPDLKLVAIICLNLSIGLTCRT